jgi:hypothetical protein
MQLTFEQFAVQCEGIRTRLTNQSATADDSAKCVKFLTKMMIGIHPVEKPVLREEIRKLPFSDNETKDMLNSLSCLKDGGSTLFQDFTSMPKFLTHSVVNNLSAEATDDVKLGKLLRWAQNLGLRAPSAPTMQALTGMLLMLTGKAGASHIDKKNMLDHVKDQWKQRVIFASAPAFIIGNLPSSPANMAKFADADWWTCNMGGRFEDVISQFVAIDEVEWQMLVKSIPIRSTRIEIRGQLARPAPPLAPTPQPVPPPVQLADLVSLLQAAIAQPLRSQPALAPPSQPGFGRPAPLMLALPAPQPPTEEPEDEPTQTANEAIQSGRVSLLDSAQALLDHATGINDGKGAKFFRSLWVSQVW